MSGQRRTAAIPLAADRPTRSEPTNPGRTATATASMPALAIPERARASSITGTIRSTWAREASSGTTPRHRAWSSSWLATTLESTTRERSMTAAAVSSQVVSIANSGTGGELREERGTDGESPRTSRRRSRPSYRYQ